MYAANSHVIRRASSADAIELRRLAASAGEKPLSNPVLIGKVEGRTAAAVSLVDLRVISDGSPGAERLPQLLLMRARSIRAHAAQPSVSERMKVLIPWGRPEPIEEIDEAA